MPLIDGVKMACAPCIRGHRSTKCNHASERVMVPVRKPGRPLSSCACPPGRGCTCGGIKVAIPRKKNCHCEGPNSEHASHESHQPMVKPEVVTPAQTPSLMPASLTKPTAFRIQKSTSTSNSARKNSISPTALDRIDSAQINVITTPTVPDMAQFHAQPSLTPHGSTPALPSPSIQEAQAMAKDGCMAPVSNAAVKSCCAPKEPTLAQPAAGMQPPVQAPDPQPDNATRGNCCGGGGSGNRTSQNVVPMQPALQVTGNMTSQFPVHHPHSLQPQILPYGIPLLLPQGTMYYPPQYGTWEQPITLSGYAQLQLQQQQVQQAILAQQQLHLQLAGQPQQQLQLEQALPASVGSMHSTTHATDGLGQGVSHQCGCGPGCACIGCVSHPFNAQTLQYVNDAYNFDLGKTTVDMLGESNNGIPQHQVQANNTYATTNGTNLPTPPHYQAQMQDPESLSPQLQAETPSDASSLGEEQTFPASDFLFIDLPSCDGQLAMCPCGDDCQCIGCTIHNNELMLAIGGQQDTMDG